MLLRLLLRVEQQYQALPHSAPQHQRGVAEEHRVADILQQQLSVGQELNA